MVVSSSPPSFPLSLFDLGSLLSPFSRVCPVFHRTASLSPTQASCSALQFSVLSSTTHNPLFKHVCTFLKLGFPFVDVNNRVHGYPSPRTQMRCPPPPRRSRLTLGHRPGLCPTCTRGALSLSVRPLQRFGFSDRRCGRWFDLQPLASPRAPRPLGTGEQSAAPPRDGPPKLAPAEPWPNAFGSCWMTSYWLREDPLVLSEYDGVHIISTT